MYYHRVIRLFIFIVMCGCVASSSTMFPPLKQTIQCNCGKVKIAIDSHSALRLVCYCKDCRGYYNTLNKNSKVQEEKYNAILDPWGGVDYTQVYPSEIKVLQGQDNLAMCIIRTRSPIRRVYTKCCHTPMFTIGNAASLLNTHLLDDKNKPDVRFRIIGRDSLPQPKDNNKELKKPSISWSVPLPFVWIMFGRVNAKKMKPWPIHNDDNVKPTILENFQEG